MVTDQFQELIGRLKVHFIRPGRAKSLKLEGYLDQLYMSEILKAQYTGEAFCGYENINHEFSALESNFSQQKNDWKAAPSDLRTRHV